MSLSRRSASSGPAPVRHPPNQVSDFERTARPTSAKSAVTFQQDVVKLRVRVVRWRGSKPLETTSDPPTDAVTRSRRRVAPTVAGGLLGEGASRRAS